MFGTSHATPGICHRAINTNTYEISHSSTNYPQRAPRCCCTHCIHRINPSNRPCYFTGSRKSGAVTFPCSFEGGFFDQLSHTSWSEWIESGVRGAAALSLWHYFEASVAFIFAGNLISPKAANILVALKSGPRTMSQVHELFGRNATKADIEYEFAERSSKIVIGIGGADGGKVFRLK